MPPRVTAAVLNFNGRALLEVLLPSLASQSFADLEIVIVDNGSSDDSLAYLARSWPGAQVVALPRNVGVAGALNVCMQAGSGELVLLLNNDVELEQRCVQELVLAL